MKNVNNQDNLYKALGLFIEALRPYAVAKLMDKAEDRWADLYYTSLTPGQKDNWDAGIRSGTSPQNLIDFHNLKGFSLKHKDLLKDDFKRNINKLPTWFEEIADVRHKCTHYHELEALDYQRAFNNMILIARQVKMPELEEAIIALRDNKAPKPKEEETSAGLTGLIPWFRNVTPHMDIRQGNLDESVFAANLAEVALGNSREIYQNPTFFFPKTYFTSGLKNISRRVIKCLNGGEDAENRVITLQTGFGGGKTHVLISLYHIAKSRKKIVNSQYARDIIKYTGEPQFEKANIAVFTNTTNDPTQGREVDGLHIRTLWGELAYQLGGKEAYELIRANDQNRTAPKGLFKQILEQTKPGLILIDELADYCVAASGVSVGVSTLSDQTVSFIQELSQAVSSTDRCVMVATLPASAGEVGNSPQASEIFNSLSNRLARVSADTKPVADEEIFEVIRRRLFEDLGNDEQTGNVISAYMNLYQELPTEVPTFASRAEYREKLHQSYPFHPELIEMFRIRWASHHDFQRTRGVLRLLASIVTDLWKRQGTMTGTHALIHTSDVNFENLDALSGQLKKLYGNGYDAVMTADVSGNSSNAFKIDKDKSEYGTHALTQGIASTLLLGSFGSTGANKGVGVDELKLCVIKPAAFNHNSVNGALDALEGRAHYLYYSSTGSRLKRYWFYTKPNMNILINQAKNEIKKTEIDGKIIDKLKDMSKSVRLFNVLVDPSEDIPEQKNPTLIVLGPKEAANPDEIESRIQPRIEKLATKKGNSERIYRNTFLFLICSEIGLSRLSSDLREYLACQKIMSDYQGQLDTDQKDDLKRKIEEISKQSDSTLVAAYSIVAKYSAKYGVEKLVVKQFKNTLDQQINLNIIQLLVDEEWILGSVGLGTLRTNNLLPTKDNPIRTLDVYEAFIRYDDKPIVTGINAVQESLLKYCYNGEFAIASGDGTTFKKTYYKEPVLFFDVSDANYWLVDKSLYKPKEPETPEEKKKPKEPTQDTIKPSPPGEELKSFKYITISGIVDLASYSHIFSSLIMPLQNNRVEIEIKIKGTSTKAHPITKTSDQYKITKESAYQLGLDFKAEE